MGSGATASVTAVIAAAGSGERLGAGGPKAFVPLAGRPMVEWSIDAFRRAGVAAIVVAVPAGPRLRAGRRTSRTAPTRRRRPPSVRVLAGGETRSASVSNALAVVETELVAIHDAARPLLTAELIEGVLATLGADPEAAGAIAAAPVTDTIKRATPASSSRRSRSASGRKRRLVVGETLDRAELWAAQTPQVFRVEALRAALDGRFRRRSPPRPTRRCWSRRPGAGS